MQITSFIKILIIPAIIVFIASCEMPIYAPAQIDLNQKGTETTGTQTYDAEDHTTDNWSIFDNWPDGAAINNEEDNSNKRIIHLEGTGLMNGFALRKTDGTYLNNTDATKIQWKAKFDHDFLIYISLELDDGNVTYLSYRARNYRSYPDVLSFVLPKSAESGLWETTSRDITKDLHQYLPKRSIVSILDFEVRGGGYIDNVTLSVDDNITDPDNNVTDPDNNITDPDNNITDPDNNIMDPDNIIPVADAGENQLVTSTGTLVTLDGNGSYDVDNDPLTYQWTMREKPFGSTAVLLDDTTEDPTFTADKEGSYTIELVVNDGTADSNASTVTVKNFPCITDHNGFDYCPVISPETAQVWLDRNLGAAEVCSVSQDTACYGDYYQWGRDSDGHQEFDSETNATQVADLNSTGSKFIIENDDWTSTDNDGDTRSTNWSKTDGNSICPAGYSVPTLAELTDENIEGANSFLKLPFAGYRDINGTIRPTTDAGSLWSSDTGSTPNSSKSLTFDNSFSYGNIDAKRAIGIPVRCIKK